MENHDFDFTNIINCKLIGKSVYTIEEIKDILNIGRNQAYELAKRNEFPVKTIGRKKVIPVVTFNKWLYMEQHKSSN